MCSVELNGVSEYQLYIFPKGKEYRETLIDWKGVKHDLPLFGVCNAVLSAMNTTPKHVGITEYASNVISLIHNNLRFTSLDHELLFPYLSESPIELPLLSESRPDYKGLCYFFEFQAIKSAVKGWLSPINKSDEAKRNKYILPSDNYCDNIRIAGGIDYKQALPSISYEVIIDDTTDIGLFYLLVAHEAVGFRSKQISSELIAMDSISNVKIYRATTGGTKESRYVTRKPILSRLYSSKQGLLPFIWAEIMHAVEHDVYAGFCEICGLVFPHTNHRFNKKTCSRECSNQRNNNKLREMDPELRKNSQNLRQAKSRAKKKQGK